MKKILNTLFITVFAVMLTTGLVSCGNKLSAEEITEILGTNYLPTEYVITEYALDMTDLKQVVGDADYVFVCKTKGYLSTEYNSDDIPTTRYTIEVIENIKGELKAGEDIVLRKAGGIKKNHKSFYLYSDDSLPKVNHYYIVSVYGQPSGDILACGENTNIALASIENYKTDINYTNILEAYENEIVSNRTRYKSKYDVNFRG
ncbi:MAG: hypothetical protein LBE13_11665 [Bacteroidales bacterium]|nr:hypothetical protein [Bacteroidales bacterium]